MFLKQGDNEVTYDIKTSQIGSIVDIIGVFAVVNTDREYILKSSENGNEKFLVVGKEVALTIPDDTEKVQPEIIEEEVPQIKKKGFFEKIWEFIKKIFGG